MYLMIYFILFIYYCLEGGGGGGGGGGGRAWRHGVMAYIRRKWHLTCTRIGQFTLSNPVAVYQRINVASAARIIHHVIINHATMSPYFCKA